MDYDDIDYDEGYSIRDIDNNWLNRNMDYGKTNSDYDSDIDDYNYNSNTNNWSTLIGDKINQQPDRHDNSLLDKINKKLEFLETVERSTIYTKLERKNDGFLNLLERMKALNSPLEKERQFEPHHRSPLAKTMIDNWHNRQKNNSVSIDISMNMTNIKNSKKDSLIETSDKQNNLKILKPTLTECKEDSHIVQKKSGLIEVEKESSLIDIIQKKELDIMDEDKEKGMIRKDIVKEMLEKIERQNANTLKLANIETLRKKLLIERDIEKERHMSRKQIEKERHNSDSLEKIVNKEEKDNSFKKSNSLKEEIDERLKSIERSMTYRQDNSLAELIKKI